MPKEPELQLVDLNVLPEELRPRVIPPLLYVVAAVAGALVIGALAGQIMLRSVRAQVQDINEDLRTTQAELAALRTPDPETVALSDELQGAEQAIEDFRGGLPAAVASRRDWGTVFDAILAFDPDTVHVSDMFQGGDDITLTGLALTQDDVLTYASSLERSGVFQRVIVQSMQDVEQPFPSPYATVASAPTPEGQEPGTPSSGATGPAAATTVPAASEPTATPTTSPYDRYETDDYQPGSIAIGDTQRHNFNPIYDVDAVTFMGRTGHTYCIAAVGEVAELDPVLEVTVGSDTYTNDNCQTQTSDISVCQCPLNAAGSAKAALVEISIYTAFDQGVTVRVTNQGQYGPTMYYALSVTDVSEGDASGAVSDIYEVDDTDPRLIRPGEQQKHTFFPDGDVDRVYFEVVAGRYYSIDTYSLTAGVDTVMSVLANGVVYQNDDREPGDSSSLVTFTAAQDGQASVTITNRGTYSTVSDYWLQLSELTGTITPTPTLSPTGPTATPTQDCGDDYEYDDDEPGHSISIGVEQVHTFCPSGDVDRVYFTAKAGRVYRVESYDLTAGVDTDISVAIAGSTYGNDDRAASDLSSMIEVQNSTTSDATAYVEVTNKGSSGVGMGYSLLVTDLGPSDAYEVDDVNGVEIFVGQSQSRTFFPTDDIDKVFFVAAPGTLYEVMTDDLSAGTDTVLSVYINGQTYTNDDSNTSTSASYLQFQNNSTSSTRAVVTIKNVGDYGPEQSYRLSVDATSSGDVYEVDDENPAEITPGTAQDRVFYPAGDVDQVVFYAEAYSRYSMYTYDLSSGTDTVMTVDMGGLVWVLDDRSATDRSSYFEIHNQNSYAVETVIKIENTGSYGVEQTYSVAVVDLGSEAPDAYEPDITSVKYIVAGESQLHTFQPDLDIDRVILLASANRRYSVMTCGNSTTSATGVLSTVPFDPVALGCDALGSGVDTLIVVSGPVRQCTPSGCQNDDAVTSAIYDNSRVEFVATAAGAVTITIYNKGTYGADRAYYLRLYDLGVVPTPTKTVTRTPTKTPTITPTGTAGPSPTSTRTPTATGTQSPVVTPSSTLDPYAPPASETPTLTLVPGTTPSPSPSPSSYPVPEAWLVVPGQHRASAGLAALQFRPALQSESGTTTVQFVLLLRMKKVGS